MGVDEGTPVSEEYKERDNQFTGKIVKVTIDLKEIKAASAEVTEKVVREASARKRLASHLAAAPSRREHRFLRRREKQRCR